MKLFNSTPCSKLHTILQGVSNVENIEELEADLLENSANDSIISGAIANLQAGLLEVTGDLMNISSNFEDLNVEIGVNTGKIANNSASIGQIASDIANNTASIAVLQWHQKRLPPSCKYTVLPTLPTGVYPGRTV